MRIKYIDGPPTDAHENAVIKAGYRWVRTNTLGPDGRLGMHGHSGPNTHLIVAGSLQFENSTGKSKYCRSLEDVVENPKLVKIVLDEADPTARKELHVPGHNFYKAVSAEGASFVEGHRSLSPQTAERFIDRGTLRIVPDEGTTAWPEQEALQKLLREAKWFPRGEQGLDNTLKPVMRWEGCDTAANRDSKGSLRH